MDLSSSEFGDSHLKIVSQAICIEDTLRKSCCFAIVLPELGLPVPLLQSLLTTSALYSLLFHFWVKLQDLKQFPGCGEARDL